MNVISRVDKTMKY